MWNMRVPLYTSQIYTSCTWKRLIHLLRCFVVSARSIRNVVPLTHFRQYFATSFIHHRILLATVQAALSFVARPSSEAVEENLVRIQGSFSNAYICIPVSVVQTPRIDSLLVNHLPSASHLFAFASHYKYLYLKSPRYCALLTTCSFARA